jgi:hypothetical protein
MDYQQTDWKGRRCSYSLHYAELKQEHARVCMMTDEEFIACLPEVTHLAAALSWLKELSMDETLGDCGIIHQLIHLMHIPDEPQIVLADIRQQYKTLLMLV